MMAALDWYFDFISPFSYLQHALLPTLPEGTEIRLVPVFLPGLLQHWETKGPAEVAPKRTWTFEHCMWLAHKHAIPLTAPAYHPFNPLPLLRLCIALGSTPAVVQRLFDYVWRDGRLPTDDAAWQALLQELHATPEMLDTPEIKQQLRSNGEQAIALGIFGVPTAAVDGRYFWGVDATDMLAAYLQGDAFFESPQFRSAQTLPQGIQRKVKPAA
jgi:2-hydroxychromene-2-carboxylate isomerase